MKNIFRGYYDILIDKRKFIFIYVIGISILTLKMFSRNNFLNPKTEILFFAFSVFLGIFLILYGFKNKNSLHKVAFLIIILVGGLTVFFTPPFIIPDEYFHINNTLYLLDGHLFTENSKMIAGKLYVMVNRFYEPLYGNLYHLFKIDPGINAFIFQNDVAFTKISNYANITVYDRIASSSHDSTVSAPFYPYIFSAIGLFIAKFFDLGIIHGIWLSRIPNLIVYGLATFFAIKRVPAYKMGLLVISCNPLILSLVASSNYDSFIFTCLIIAIALFISMYYNKVTAKKFSAFIILCLLMSFIKVPWIFILILLFFIPFKRYNFKRINKHQYNYILASIIAIGVIGFIIWACLIYFNVIQIHENTLKRMIYFLTIPENILDIINHSIYLLKNLIISTPGYREYLVGSFKGAILFDILYFIFFIVFSVLYPFKVKLSKNKKILLGLCCAVFYFGMFFLISIMWDVRPLNFTNQIQARYFIPLLPLIPLVINHPFKKIKDIEYYTLTGVIIFSVSLLMFLITHFY